MKTLSIITLLFLSVISFGQNEKKDFDSKIRKNAVYFELGGNGGLYSINYDRIVISGKRTHLSLRGGLSIAHFSYFVPLEINFLFGKRHNFFELGFGETLDVNNKRAGGGIGFNHYLPFMRIGYRLQKKTNENGLLFRAGLTPTFIVDEGEGYPIPFAGVSIGYAF